MKPERYKVYIYRDTNNIVMRVDRALLLILLLVGSIVFLWYNNAGTSNKEQKFTAIPVKSLVYDYYPWLTDTEIVRIIYSYPRYLANTTYFFVELEIPDEVINYLASLANSKYVNIEPKEGLFNPVIFAAKSVGSSFSYAGIFNYKVVENSTYGIPKKIIVTLSSDNVPIDYNLIIVEFFRPYQGHFYNFQYGISIDRVGQVIGGYRVERRDGGPSVFIGSDEYWAFAIISSAYYFTTPAPVVLSRDVYIPVYSNDSLFVKADYGNYGQGNVGVAIGLLFVMKDGSKIIASFEDGVDVDYYSGVSSATGIPVCKIKLDLRKLQSVRAFVERNCAIDWNNLDYVSKVYIGINAHWYSDIVLRNFFVGYLT